MVTFRNHVQDGTFFERRKKAPFPHEDTAMKADNPEVTAKCQRISELLSRVGDKWTIQVIRMLGEGPQRFNALRREISDISQKMLATTLRNLERDGFVSRTVQPTKPPQVEYALTPLGRDLQCPVFALAQWTSDNAHRIEAARQAYDEAAGEAAA
jgi:DNA-binding HxlR family transcriptional regulator